MNSITIKNKTLLVNFRFFIYNGAYYLVFKFKISNIK